MISFQSPVHVAACKGKLMCVLVIDVYGIGLSVTCHLWIILTRFKVTINNEPISWANDVKYLVCNFLSRTRRSILSNAYEYSTVLSIISFQFLDEIEMN